VSYGTIQSGTVSVAVYENGMPYIGTASAGQLTGLDGEVFTSAAHKLGLTIKSSTMTFAALLSAVQTQRVDAGIGDIGWRAARAQSALFTDPPYYSPIAMAVRPGVSISSIAGIAGHAVGTLTGGFYTQGLKALPNVSVQIYQTVDAELADLQASRIDLFFYDPLSLKTIQKQRPDIPFNIVYPTPPSADEVKASPGLADFQPFMTGWYLAPQEKGLENALNGVIKQMYKSGEMARLIAKWGGNPQAMLTPQPYFASERVGVDRATGWAPPSLSS
jgi:ABC-type amino acid transport substrate-binding protein